jgi:membrane protein implicated in regulation of membrane protease activity
MVEASKYVTAYVVSAAEPLSKFIVLNGFLLCLGFGAVMLSVWRLENNNRRTAWRESCIVLVVFVLLALMLSSSRRANVVNREELRKALTTNNTNVVEGAVHDFHPMKADGHGNESFCVRQICFRYNESSNGGGYNETIWTGGVIRRNGMKVRIEYVSDFRIVKIEVATD